MPTLLVAVRTDDGGIGVLTVVWAGIVGNSPAMMALRIGSFMPRRLTSTGR